MAEKKNVFCPRCKNKVATYDGKGKIDVITKCKKCNVRVIYRVATGKIEIKKIPPRSCSSGIIFTY